MGLFESEPRRQNSRRKGAKRLSEGSKFEIKHKNRFLQKSKSVDWGGRRQAPLLLGGLQSKWTETFNDSVGVAVITLKTHYNILELQ